jgi:hypothetical protein
MSDAGNVAKSLRERLGANTEDRFGRALSELLESPLLTGAIGAAFDAREKASQAQEVAMGALNLPSAADIERLTRRLRAVSHRLEGIEDGVDRLDRALTPSGVEARLSAIETRLEQIEQKLDATLRRPAPAAPASAPARAAAPARAGRRPASAKQASAKRERARELSAAKAAKAGREGRTATAGKAAGAPASPGARSRASRGAPGKT